MNGCMLCEHFLKCSSNDMDASMDCTLYHKVVMTPKEFAEKMRGLQSIEDDDARCDAMLKEIATLLRGLGYSEGAVEFLMQFE